MARAKAKPTLWIRGSVDSKNMKAELARIQAETKDFAGKVNIALKAVNEETDKAKKKTKQLASANSVLTGALERVGHRLTDTVLRGLQLVGTAFNAAVTDTIAFHKQFAEVDTLIDGSPQHMDKMQQAALQMMGAFGQSQQDVIKGFYDTISAGFEEGSEAINLMTTANKLAVAGVTDAATAVDGITSVLNSFSLEGRFAELAANNFFVAMQKGKTTVPELAQNIGRLAPVARAAGISMDETFAAVSTMTTGGIRTDESIIGVRQALVTLLSPSAEAQKLAKKLKLEFTQTALQTKGLGTFLADLATKVKGNKEATAQFFGNVRALNAVLALGKDDGKKYQEVLGDIESRTDALNSGFEKISDTVGFKLQQFTQLRKSMLQTFVSGAANSNALKGALDGLNSVTNVLLNSFIDNALAIDITQEEAQRFVEGALTDLLSGFAEAIRVGVGWYESIRSVTTALLGMVKIGTGFARFLPGFSAVASVFEGLALAVSEIAEAGLQTEMSETSKSLLAMADGIDEYAGGLLQSKATGNELFTSQTAAVRDLREEINALNIANKAAAKNTPNVLGGGAEDTTNKTAEKSLSKLAKMKDKLLGGSVIQQGLDGIMNGLGIPTEEQFDYAIQRFTEVQDYLTEKTAEEVAGRKELAQSYHDHMLGLQALEIEAAMQTAETIAEIASGVIATAFSSIGNSIVDVIKGTETLGDAMKNLGETIVKALLNSLVRMAADAAISWVTTELIKTFATKAAGKTAIATNSGIAASAAFAATAGIPIVGPALAPGAAAAAGAGAKAIGLGFAAFTAADGGVVPGVGMLDSVPAILRPNERVLTPGENSTFEGLMRSLSASPVAGGANNRSLAGGPATMNSTVVLNIDRQLGDQNDQLRALVTDVVAPMFFEMLGDGAIGENSIALQGG